MVILGVNGELGSSIATHHSINTHDTDIIGIDIHDTSSFDQLAWYFTCDFGKRLMIRETLEKLPLNKYKNIFFISCIGYFGSQTINDEKFNEDRLYQSIQINLTGIAHFFLTAVDECIHHDISARIIIVGSAAGSVGSRDIGYGISKAGLNGLVLSLSKCFSTKNISVMGINPGIIESKMSESVSSERQNQAIESTHIKRKGYMKEITDFVYYVTFNSPDYLTGSILNINGGQYS